MTGTRYTPQKFVNEPKLFARNLHATFLEQKQPIGFTDQSGRERREALKTNAFALRSRWQHTAAFAIRFLLKCNGLMMTDYSRILGESYKRTNGMLCGSVVMRPDDVDRAAQTLLFVHEVITWAEKEIWDMHHPVFKKFPPVIERSRLIPPPKRSLKSRAFEPVRDQLFIASQWRAAALERTRSLYHE